MTKCIETWVARIGDPRHTRESEYVMGIIRDRIHICSSISSFKVTNVSFIVAKGLKRSKKNLMPCTRFSFAFRKRCYESY